MSNDAETALLDRDNAHLLHPLHSRATHATGKVWVGGDGAFLVDANGDRYIDGLSGPLEQHRRQRLPRADRGREQAARRDGVRVGVCRQHQPARDRAGREARADHLPQHQPLLLHVGRRRGDRQQHQDGPLLLEAERSAGEDQGHLAHLGLSRRHARGHVRDGHEHLLADVRAAHAGLRPHPEPLSLSLRGAGGGGEPGHRRGRRAGEGHSRGRAGDSGDVHRRAGAGRRRRDSASARLLPAHPRDLHQVRRADGVGRGHHRVRPHRQDVRPAALGRRARHDPVRQGDHVGLLLPRRHRDQRRDRQHDARERQALDARLHLQRASHRLRHRLRHARPGRTGGFPRPGRGKRANACWSASRTRSPIIPMSATSGDSGSCAPWST